MEKSLQDKLIQGYNEYLKLPLASIVDDSPNELFHNGWVVVEGLGIVYPDPHRY